ncbi:MAG: NFACT family protein [Planctomycetota bacterium]
MSPGPDRTPPAPMGIRPEEVRLLIEEMQPLVVGARVDKVFDAGPGAFLLRLRHGKERLPLFISTRRGFSRFHIDDSEAEHPARPSEVAMELRASIGGAKVTKVDQPVGDRLLRIAVQVRREERLRKRVLVFELFGSRGRLVVYEEPQRRIIFHHGRGAPESPYRFPEQRTPPGDRAFLPLEPRNLIEECDRSARFPFHRALARTMTAAEEQADLNEAHSQVQRQIERELRRQRKLLTVFDRDLAAAGRWEEHQNNGELLKGEIGRLARGDKEVVVTDYFDAALPQRTIALDPRKTPAENIEACFKKARKGKRGLEQIQSRRQAAADQIVTLEEAASTLGQIPSWDGVKAARELLPAPSSKRRRKGEARRKDELPTPRRYVTRQGLEVLAGKSARENERLSLHVAHGNDLFFHVARRPGPHVILRVPAGKTASPESIEDAAFLAAYLSGWRGPGSLDVHWTAAKFVRRRKGAPLGTVEISQEREYRVAYRPELLEHLVVDTKP